MCQCHLQNWWAFRLLDYVTPSWISLWASVNRRYRNFLLSWCKRSQQDSCCLQLIVQTHFWLSYSWKCHKFTINSCTTHVGNACVATQKEFLRSSCYVRSRLPCTHLLYLLNCLYLFFICTTRFSNCVNKHHIKRETDREKDRHIETQTDGRQ